MHLLDRSRRRPLALLLLACPACVPGSLKLGEDTEDVASSGSADASDTGSDTGPDIGSDTGEPTTGEPAPEGVLEWTKKYEDIGGLDMAIAADGSIVVVGMSGYSFNGGDGGQYANTWLGKFDAAGAPLWEVETPLGPEIFQSSIAVALGSDGVIHVLDIDYGVLEGGGNQVRRFGPDGAPLGATTLLARPASIAATASGVIVGGGRSTGDNTGVAWVTALDDAGLPVWERTFGDPMMRWASVYTIAVDGDEVILGGALGVEPGSTKSQAWLLRAAVADGATIWDRTLGEAVATDAVHDVGLTGDGTIVARVRADADYVRGFDPAGVELWEHPLTDVLGTNFAIAGDGSFVLTGGLYLPIEDPNACSAGSGPCPVAMQVARHEADRSLRWSATRDECTSGNVVAITPDDRVLVLAGCSKDGLSDAVMGLMMFAP